MTPTKSQLMASLKELEGELDLDRDGLRRSMAEHAEWVGDPAKWSLRPPTDWISAFKSAAIDEKQERADQLKELLLEMQTSEGAAK